jgi:glycosyltransferase involved in cell wall biosynthesis
LIATKAAGQAEGATRRYRVAVVNTHPIQYFAPLYAYLNTNCPEIELEVLYLSDCSLRNARDPGFAAELTWDIDMLAGYRSRFLGRNYGSVEPRGFWSLRTVGVWGAIRNGGYDLVWLHGYNHAALILAAMAAKWSSAKLALRGDSHLLLNAPGPRRAARNAIISAMFKAFDCFFAVGERNRDYYRYLGVPERKIYSLPYAVDNERFAPPPRTRRPGPPRILFASKLIERKDPASLVEAAAILRDRNVDVDIEVAGSGPLLEKIQQMAQDRGLENITFRGFVNQSLMPDLLANSDIFVLTSSWEPFGLIVNEAMAAGMLAVVSHDVGCSLDLVEPGISGARVRSNCPVELANALQLLIERRHEWPQMIAAARKKIDRYSFAHCATGLREALAA